MAKGFKHGAGGSPLNFKVVAYATEELLKADTPKENTIGIITDVKVTGCYFQTKQPEAMAEGEVWISTDKTTRVKFNALKKNVIEVHPSYAKQSIDGKLVDKTAKIYSDGKWVEWIAYLYNKGELFTDITGGWTTDGYYASGLSLSAPTFEQDKMNLDRGNVSHRGVGTRDLIDTTGFTKLKFYGAVTGVGTFNGNQYGICLKLCPSKNYADQACAARLHLLQGTYNGAALNIPEGKYYVVVHTEAVAGITGYMTSLKLE